MYISEEMVLSPNPTRPCVRLQGYAHRESRLPGLLEATTEIEGVAHIESKIIGTWVVCHAKDNTL